MAIEFVGSVTTSTSGSLSLTSLTGGVDTAPEENDIVIVAINGNAASNDDIAVSGYTEVADLYANASFYDTNFGVFYKIMSSSPDTTVTIPSITGLRAVVYVVRGVDTTTPQDAAATTATKTNSGIPDSPSITSATDNAMILTLCGTSKGGVYTAPSGFSNTAKSETTFSNVLVASKIKATAGSDNPAIWSSTGGSDNTVFSCASVTMALRPAGAGGTGRIKVLNGSAWVAKPVKVWNGSSWVTKPVKVWNGSAWVTTNY